MLGNIYCSFRIMTKFNFVVLNANVLLFVKNAEWSYSCEKYNANWWSDLVQNIEWVYYEPNDGIAGEVSISKKLFEG